jgi:hypothetical protein
MIEGVSVEYGGRVPKKGDRVGTISHKGVFAVIETQPETRTATIELLDVDGPLVAGIPWTTLTFDDDPARTAPSKLHDTDTATSFPVFL